MNRLGEAAEQQACTYLQQQGLRLLARNYQCRFGEIDLVMQQGAVVVFVEVRSRRSNRFGGAAASITADKQRKLWATAQHYLANLPHATPACRFDAITLDGNRLDWLTNIIQP
jgi:putative endonuclease